jgi:DNA-binding NarL/FixJ family response regulator
MPYLRVLVADDHAGFRERITEMLEGDFDIIASVGNGKEALLATLTLQPDLLITDISMPILDGVQLACKLRNSGCNTKIIFLTVHDDADYVEAVFATGALGYVLKANVGTDLLLAIQEVLEGRQFTSELPLHRHA